MPTRVYQCPTCDGLWHLTAQSYAPTMSEEKLRHREQWTAQVTRQAIEDVRAFTKDIDFD